MVEGSMLRVVGYCRVSTEEQTVSGAGMGAQRQAVEAECERRGWTLVTVIEDAGYSARDLKRPGVQEALDMLRRREADALCVSKLDRLSRSLLDFASLMNVAQRQRWSVIALDANVDTSTPAGEALVGVLATFAQFERRLIGQRTKEALAVKKAQGIRLGRPVVLADEVRERVVRERRSGRTLQAIADRLNDDGVATAHGGSRWWPSTVRGVLASAELCRAA